MKPPSIDEWIDALQQLLGLDLKVSRKDQQQHSLADISEWGELGKAEDIDLSFAQAKDPEVILSAHPWLVVCERLAGRYGFFHWELDFAPVFARGGFDLQVGNPPWVRPDFDENAVLAEFNVAFALETKITTAQAREDKLRTLSLSFARHFYLEELGSTVAIRAFVSSPPTYPHLEGLRPDLYRCFMEHDLATPISTRSCIAHPSRNAFHRREGRRSAGGNLHQTSAALAVHQRTTVFRSSPSGGLRYSRVRSTA